jgi:hypothetical protein
VESREEKTETRGEWRGEVGSGDEFLRDQDPLRQWWFGLQIWYTTMHTPAVLVWHSPTAFWTSPVARSTLGICCGLIMLSVTLNPSLHDAMLISL